MFNTLLSHHSKRTKNNATITLFGYFWTCNNTSEYHVNPMVISGLVQSDSDDTATVLCNNVTYLYSSTQSAISSPEKVLCVAHVYHIVLSTNFLKVQGDEAWLVHVDSLK